MSASKAACVCDSVPSAMNRRSSAALKPNFTDDWPKRTGHCYGFFWIASVKLRCLHLRTRWHWHFIISSEVKWIVDRRSYANKLQCAAIDNFEKEQICSLRMCAVVCRNSDFIVRQCFSMTVHQCHCIGIRYRYRGIVCVCHIFYRFFSHKCFFHLICIAMQTWHFSSASTCLALTLSFWNSNAEMERIDCNKAVQCALCISELHFQTRPDFGKVCKGHATVFILATTRGEQIPNLVNKPVKAVKTIIIMFEENNCISANDFVEGNIFWQQECPGSAWVNKLRVSPLIDSSTMTIKRWKDGDKIVYFLDLLISLSANSKFHRRRRRRQMSEHNYYYYNIYGCCIVVLTFPAVAQRVRCLQFAIFHFISMGHAKVIDCRITNLYTHCIRFVWHR